MHHSVRILTGLWFGNLRVLCPSDKRQSNGGMMWVCKCKCGKVVEARQDNLLTHRVRSCGTCKYRPYKPKIIDEWKNHNQDIYKK